MANGQWRGFAPTCLPSLPSISSIFSEFPRLSASVLYLTLIFMIAHLYINRCFAFSGLSGLPLSLLAYCADFIIIFIWHGWHKKQSEEQDRKENSFSCSAAARHRQADRHIPALAQCFHLIFQFESLKIFPLSLLKLILLSPAPNSACFSASLSAFVAFLSPPTARLLFCFDCPGQGFELYFLLLLLIVVLNTRP